MVMAYSALSSIRLFPSLIRACSGENLARAKQTRKLHPLVECCALLARVVPSVQNASWISHGAVGRTCAAGTIFSSTKRRMVLVETPSRLANLFDFRGLL